MNRNTKKTTKAAVVFLMFCYLDKSEVVLRYINSFYFENDRSCAIIAAGNHNLVIICPSVHDCAALKC